MDHDLVRWARAVKARRRLAHPPLWLFADAVRVPDLAAAVAALPRGLCGVVFRPEGYPPGLAPRIARLCRDRRLWLTVASGPVPAGAGRHLRRGRGRAGAFATASAHDRAEVLRARRAGAALVFLSPLFPTASHPGGAWLGPLRWARAAHGVPAAALGGVDGRNLRRVPGAVAAGAIGALLPDGRKWGTPSLPRPLSRHAGEGGGPSLWPRRHSAAKMPRWPRLRRCG